MGVITQYQSHTLVQHIQRGWSFFNEEMNEFVDLLPAQQRMKGENWYRGTADAVTQNLDIIRRYKAVAGLRLNVDILQLQELLMDIGEDEHFQPSMAASGINSATLSEEILCAAERLLDVMERPLDLLLTFKNYPAVYLHNSTFA